MKRLFSLMAVILMTAITFAQSSVRVTANFSKGDYVVYDIQSATTSKAAGVDTIHFSGTVRYEVTDARSDGYDITINTLNWDCLDSIKNDVVNKIAIMQQQMLVGMPTKVTTDKEGKIIRLNNFKEIRQKTDLFVDDMVNTIFEGMDETALGVLSREGLREAIMSELTEEKMLETISNNTGNHLSLYGRTFTTGTVTDEKIGQFGFKTTYIVPASKNKDTYSLKASSVINMSKEDIKKMLIQQLEKMMPGQADAIKENIDMVLESGMIQFEGTRNCSYEFLKNGWAKSGEMTFEFSSMGNKTFSSSKFSIKESHLK